MKAHKTVRSFHPGTFYWLLAYSGPDERRTPKLVFSDRETLPVFSFREEAEMYASLGDTSGSRVWRPVCVSAEELASVLMRQGEEVTSVALDPMPGRGFGKMLPLVSLSRERFMFRLVEETRRDRSGPALKAV